MVDETGQDAIEVKSAADVAGDATQRIGSMEQVVDLLAPTGGFDHGAEIRGDDLDEIEVGGGQAGSVGADEQQGTPWSVQRPGWPRRPRCARRGARRS